MKSQAPENAELIGKAAGKNDKLMGGERIDQFKCIAIEMINKVQI